MTAESIDHDPPKTMTIRGTRDPRYWRETTDEYGHWVSKGQPGPIVVIVTHQGIQIMNDVKGSMRPSTARWLALRMIEAAAVYETQFGGDGSIPRDGKSTAMIRGPLPNVSPLGGELPPEPESKWVCGCGKSSENKGAMRVHENSNDHGPIRLITGGQD